MATSAQRNAPVLVVQVTVNTAFFTRSVVMHVAYVVARVDLSQ
jgi:hypothetical protein